MDTLRALRLALRPRYAAWTVKYCTATHPATCPECFERDGLSQSLREDEDGYGCRACGGEFPVSRPAAPASSASICTRAWAHAPVTCGPAHSPT
jgi:hypothetical protein